jgi:hypothetical protein
MKQKWAIQIKLGDADWFYLTEDTGKCCDLQVTLFDEISEALEYSKLYNYSKLFNNYKVVSYVGNY